MLTLAFCRLGGAHLYQGSGAHQGSQEATGVRGITWARCVGFYGGCVFANPASGWTFPATKYSKHNLVHYNLMIFLTEQRFGCRKSFLCEFYRLLRLRFVVKFQRNFYSSCISPKPGFIKRQSRPSVSPKKTFWILFTAESEKCQADKVCNDNNRLNLKRTFVNWNHFQGASKNSQQWLLLRKRWRQPPP